MMIDLDNWFEYFNLDLFWLLRSENGLEEKVVCVLRSKLNELE